MTEPVEDPMPVFVIKALPAGAAAVEEGADEATEYDHDHDPVECGCELEPEDAPGSPKWRLEEPVGELPGDAGCDGAPEPVPAAAGVSAMGLRSGVGDA